MSLVILKRFNSSKPIADKKQQAAQLAAQSIKDIGSIFSSSSSNDDPSTQPIDTKPIYENPQLFPSLSLLHQGQVIKELQNKYDKKWHNLTQKDKLLGYFISYGNWGVRENFNNWNDQTAPLDLPFHIPSNIKTISPSPTDIIRKLNPELKLSETPIRINQFNYKKMDPATKFIIYIIIFISLFAIYRDKAIGEAGKPKEVVIEDKYEIERQAKLKQLELELLLAKEEEIRKEKEKQRRKWYYLWLK
ncbi:uncharacterized protein KGF55_005142 [Candida pseudojiufengensis]|uniref:uncharacterized protein n=1 Tax=Candida pseudojiufengensis TaxID=497109 RepID=UPI0022258BE6|nr:uncharacterized protein KGF55_005142 [Candida pseudojiufengensis]KAI5959910.1 hypothetical protein KGF55_005142 [Candida pseudojiufengensis]